MSEKKETKAMKSDPRIFKVKMVEGGRDGIVVAYNITEVRNSLMSRAEATMHQHRPVQKELKEYFRLLKPHLLAALGFANNNKNLMEMFEENIEVTHVTMISKGTAKEPQFLIGGKNLVLGKYKTGLSSALIASSDYEDIAEFDEIVLKIFEEAKLFMDGTKGADSKTVVIDYMTVKKNNPNAAVDYANMSTEEQEAIMDEANKHYGLKLVLENGETKLSFSDESTSQVAEIEIEDVTSEEEFDLPIEGIS